MRDKCGIIMTNVSTNIRRITLLLVILNLNIAVLHGTESIWVRPFDIKFNHETGQTNDALTIRKADGTDITNPEWASYHNDDENENFAYIKAQSNRKLRVTFDSNCEDMHLVIKLTVTSGTGIGGICNLFVCNYHQLDEVILTLNGTPGTVGKRSFTWQWKIYGIPVNDPTFCAAWETTETTHTYYSLLATPQAPMAEPWSSVLDYACAWANGQTSVEDAATKITEYLYSSGFNYDSNNGAPRYGSWTSFNLTQFLSELGYSYAVNCLDMGKAVTTFTNSVGCNMFLTTFTGGFAVNYIAPLGSVSPTNNPFYIPLIGNDCRQGGFSYHAFSQDLNKKTWDACLKYDIEIGRAHV